MIAGDNERRQVVEQSKVVVLINCNLHSTEIASSQLSMELAHELATSESQRIKEILDRTIVHVPDFTRDDRFPATRTVAETSASPARSMLAVPMLREAEVFGAILITRGPDGPLLAATIANSSAALSNWCNCMLLFPSK